MFGILEGALLGGVIDSLFGEDEFWDGAVLGGIAGFLLEDWKEETDADRLREKVLDARLAGKITQAEYDEIMRRL